ncbi:hypothetical protein LENED_002205 [Lentinula edodes]|uniref:DUF6534 domain-containing protein n=1 Tax=Lentinula edodes TaxID=5353 RepID=A0A1Q3E083_LENED|nr:hypothetical protein LENED_002205 [Lentinula edodes]
MAGEGRSQTADNTQDITLARPPTVYIFYYDGQAVCTHVLAVFHFDFIDFILASAMCSSTTTVAPLHNTMGALLIGVLISCALWGISTAQTYIYFSTFYHHDTLRLKSLSVAQIIVVFASFAITMVYFEKSWSLRTWTKLADLSKISRAVNGLNFGGDITITFVMVYFLRTSRSGIKRTDALMNRLMYFCLKTGLLTTFCAILSLISISIWPNTFIYITFYCALARLYANSFLATLNARDQLRKSNRPLGSSLFSNPTLSGLEWARAMASDTVITSSDIPKSCTNPLSIKQEVETHIHHDIELDNLAAKSLSSILPA